MKYDPTFDVLFVSILFVWMTINNIHTIYTGSWTMPDLWRLVLWGLGLMYLTAAASKRKPWR